MSLKNFLGGFHHRVVSRGSIILVPMHPTLDW